MKKVVLLFAVLGSVFFAGCAKEDTAETETTVESTNPATGEETQTEVTTEVTTETAQ